MRALPRFLVLSLSCLLGGALTAAGCLDKERVLIEVIEEPRPAFDVGDAPGDGQAADATDDPGEPGEPLLDAAAAGEP